MMRRIELARGKRLVREDIERSGGIDAEVLNVAMRIVDDVRTRGDEALRDYTEQFDKATVDVLAVTEEEIEEALAVVGDDFREAISTAAMAIEDFHRRQVPQSWFTVEEGGIFLGQKVTPIERVGIYVPGGRACYPSSVLMNAIPAVVAGVEEIAMVVPPGPTARSTRTRLRRRPRPASPRSTRWAAPRLWRHLRSGRHRFRASTRSPARATRT